MSRYSPPIKGRFIKKLNQSETTGRDLAESVGGVAGLVFELKQLQNDVIDTVNTKIDEVDTKLQTHIDTIVDSTKVLKDTQTEAINLIKEIKTGPAGQDANEQKIVDYVISKFPKIDTEKLTKEILSKIPKLDEKSLTKRVLEAIPENKASLKIIQEKFEVDPMSVIERIMALPDGKFKLKSSQIDGLEQTMSAFRNQLGRGYLHGGGDTVVAGTNVTISTNASGQKVINASGGGGGTPGGLPTQLQINNAGSFGGAKLTYTEPSSTSILLKIPDQATLNTVGISTTIQSGKGNGTGNGGDVILQAGNDGDGNHTGGNIYLNGGTGDTQGSVIVNANKITTPPGQFLNLLAGDGVGSSGGDFLLFGGNGDVGHSGGNVTITGGAGNGAPNGVVQIQGATGINAIFDTSSLATTDKTFTFPNKSGTFALTSDITTTIWNEITGTSQTASVNNGYILNNAGLVTLTLPSTATQGSIIEVAGKGSGGWKVAQNAGQTVHFGNTNTTTGVGGSLASTNRYDCLRLLCITANTDFIVLSSVGNITIV